MRDVDKLIRRVLALTIRYPKRPKTKGDILRYALYIYLKGDCRGLCDAIYKATVRFQYKRDVIGIYHKNLPLVFPLFCYKIAVEDFNAPLRWKISYWWPITDWKSRYRFMRWLIKKYDKVEL